MNRFFIGEIIDIVVCYITYCNSDFKFLWNVKNVAQTRLLCYFTHFSSHWGSNETIILVKVDANALHLPPPHGPAVMCAFLLPSTCVWTRLGGSYRQSRTDILRGPRQQNHDLAASHRSPRPADPPEVQLHSADGAAEPQVRTHRHWIHSVNTRFLSLSPW